MKGENNKIAAFWSKIGLDEKAVEKMMDSMKDELLQKMSAIDGNVAREADLIKELIENEVMGRLCAIEERQAATEKDVIGAIKANLLALQNDKNKERTEVMDRIMAELRGQLADGRDLLASIQALCKQASYQAEKQYGSLMGMLETIHDTLKNLSWDRSCELQAAWNALREADFDHAEKLFEKATYDTAVQAEAYFGRALADCKIQIIWDPVKNCEQPICFDQNVDLFHNSFFKLAEEKSKKEDKQIKERMEEFAKKVQETLCFYRGFEDKKINFDCFICLKEHDGDQDTEDYKWLLEQGLYNDLNIKGDGENDPPLLSTFCAPYSCTKAIKDNGPEFEAHIMYALSTARCMIIICSNKDYLDTPWVKNEYTRFCNFLKQRNQSPEQQIIVFFKDGPVALPDRLRGTNIQDYKMTEAGKTWTNQDVVEAVKNRVERGKNYIERYLKYCPNCNGSYSSQYGYCPKCGGIKLLDSHAYLNERLKAYNEESQAREQALRNELEASKKREQALQHELEKQKQIKTQSLASTESPQGEETRKLSGKAAEAVRTAEEQRKAQEAARIAEERRKAEEARKASEAARKAEESQAREQALRNELEASKKREQALQHELEKQKQIKTQSLASTESPQGEEVRKLSGKAAEAARKAEEEKKRIEEEERKRQAEEERKQREEEEKKYKEYLAQFLIVNGELKKYLGSAKEVLIPASVISIGEEAFKDCDILKNVRFEWGSELTSVGSNAFSGCRSLKSIVIPESVTRIGANTFNDCIALERVIFQGQSQLTSIGENAFRNCRSLTSIVIPESVTSIGENAFRNCGYFNQSTENSRGDFKRPQQSKIEKEFQITGRKLIRYSGTSQHVVIPNGVTEIGFGSFRDCTFIQSIDIPRSVTSIGGSAFRGCKSLTSITIPQSVTSLGDWAFYGCISLQNIVLSKGISKIGKMVFGDCLSLIEMNLPQGINMIGDDAFSGCRSLKNIVIPKGVVSMGSGTFAYCPFLTIYCKVKHRPFRWAREWNPDGRPVVWGYNGVGK